jgi:tetratricopeptide (TPR) repeat protein
MVQTRFNKQQNPMTFDRLMHLGQIFHSQGNSKQAHEYWQQAAVLEPDNEQVWTALMWVLETDEDRKVCLKNILTINPDNLQAQAMLDELIGDTQADERIQPDVCPEPEHSRSFFFALLLLRLIQTLTFLAFIAFVMVIINNFVQLPF